MLRYQRKPVTEQEALQLRNWMMAGESLLFRSLIHAEIACLEIDAINAEVETVEFPNREMDRKNKMERVQGLRTFLDIFKEYTNAPTTLAAADITIEPSKLI